MGDRHAELALPTGTVAFLLTDIEGSSALWERSPEEMTVAVPRHYEVLDEVIDRHGGVRPVEQGEGDSVVAAFAFTSDAVAAALDAQRALHDETPILRVRMAVHAGEAQLRDGHNYVGHAVIRCARLRSCAGGGQVLVSEAAVALVADRLPDGAALVDRGTHRLRDLTRPERVWQLVHPDVASDLAPIRSLDGFRHNLPTAPTPLVGRTAELVELRSLVRDHRLVTVTGSGGVGKTRLAQQVAADLVDHFVDGVSWCELASVTDPARVVSALAASAGIAEIPGVAPLDALVGQLGDSPHLVVVDNCEHLLDAVAAPLVALLDACPDLHVLTTSREPIGVAGEVTWRAPSLGLPATDDAHPGTYDAVRLFVDRVRLARPGFVLSDANAVAVVAICTRLDGIPLALELAAARVRTMPFDRLADQLDQRFRVLTGGSRTALARQRTLLASIEWSVDLLTDDERAALLCLSAFVDGFTVEAAEAVCADGEVDEHDVLDLLGRLVDKSLVQLDDAAGRYRLLETIRAFALDHARAAGALGPSRDRHLAWARVLAASLDVEHRIPRIAAVEAIEPEAANLLAALEWSLEDEPALEVLGALSLVWVWRSRFGDAQEWTARILADLPEGSPAWVRAVAHSFAAFTAAGGPLPTRTVLETALAAAEQQGDTWAEGRVLLHLGVLRATIMPTDDHDLLDQAMATTDAAGDAAGRLHAQTMAAFFACVAARPTRADAMLDLVDANDVDDYLHGYLIDQARAMVAFQLGDFVDGAAAALDAAARAPSAPQAGLLFMVFQMALARADVDLMDRALASFPPVSRLGLWVGWHRLAVAERALLVEDHAAGVHGGVEAHRIGQAGLPAPLLSAGAALVVAATGEADLAAELLASVRPQVESERVWSLNVAVPEALIGLARDDPSLERTIIASIELADAGQQPTIAIQLLEVLACTGDVERGVRLAAAADRARRALGYWFRAPLVRDRLAHREARARADLGPRFDDLGREGDGLDLVAATAYVRRGHGSRGRPSFGWDSLTPTEGLVVDLVVEGLTNPQIAERMVVGTSTVKTHLHHVFTKVGVRTRSELAVAAVAHRAEPSRPSDDGPC